MAKLDDQDLKNIKSLIEITLDEKLEEKFNEKLSHLPDKEEFYKRTDEMMTELKNIREEQTVLAQHSRDHTDNIEKLKKIHPNFQHTSV